MGVARTTRGIIREVKVAVLNPKSAVTATINPIKLLPVSPKYIFAGGKLCIKNPIILPHIIKDKTTSNPPTRLINKAIKEMVAK